MYPAVVAWQLDVVLFVSTALGMGALTSVVGGGGTDSGIETATTLERVVWLVASVVVGVGAYIVYRAARAVEHVECDLTGRERACQAQRKASIMAGAFFVFASISAAVTTLALASVVSSRQALTVVAALHAIIALVLYFASKIAFAPMERTTPPVVIDQPNVPDNPTATL